ncbi:MAG: hypothetical protein ABIH23_30950, partial [bacterium]
MSKRFKPENIPARCRQLQKIINLYFKAMEWIIQGCLTDEEEPNPFVLGPEQLAALEIKQIKDIPDDWKECAEHICCKGDFGRIYVLSATSEKTSFDVDDLPPVSASSDVDITFVLPEELGEWNEREAENKSEDWKPPKWSPVEEPDKKRNGFIPPKTDSVRSVHFGDPKHFPWLSITDAMEVVLSSVEPRLKEVGINWDNLPIYKTFKDGIGLLDYIEKQQLEPNDVLDDLEQQRKQYIDHLNKAWRGAVRERK